MHVHDQFKQNCLNKATVGYINKRTIEQDRVQYIYQFNQTHGSFPRIHEINKICSSVVDLQTFNLYTWYWICSRE